MRSHFCLNTPGSASALPPARTTALRSHFVLGCAVSSAAAMMTGVCSAQFSAADYATDPAYAGGWSAGQNGGYGFGAWSFDATAGGSMQAMSTGSALGTAWTLFNTSASSGIANAGRSINGGLGVGQTLETVIQNPGANNFYRGFDILFLNGTDNNAAGNNAAAIRLSVFNYGTQFWNINDIGSTATPISAPVSAAAGMRIDLSLTSTTTYALTMTPLNGAGAYSYNGTFAGPINYVDFREWDTASAGAGDTANNFNIGYLTVTTVPEPATLSLLGLGAAGLLFFRRRA